MDKKLDKIIELLEEVKKLQNGRKCKRCGHTSKQGSTFCDNCQDDMDYQ